MVIEKRKSPRTTALLEIIYYSEKKSSRTAPSDPQRIYYSGTIVNTSRRGVGILTSYPHQPREELWFEGIGAVRRPLQGTVQWITRRQNQYGVGIRLEEDLG